MKVVAKNMKKIISENIKKENKKYIKATIKTIKRELINNEYDTPMRFNISGLFNVKEVEKYFNKRGFKTSFKDEGLDIYLLKLSWDD